MPIIQRIGVNMYRVTLRPGQTLTTCPGSCGCHVQIERISANTYLMRACSMCPCHDM
jgi:hypothetical protein